MGGVSDSRRIYFDFGFAQVNPRMRMKMTKRSFVEAFCFFFPSDYLHRLEAIFEEILCMLGFLIWDNKIHIC